jgi:glycosyltransferase involved in cell wall biosynthesis
VKVAAIIPAYNEATRIPAVLEAVVAAKLLNEIVVVNDGSTDDTLRVLKSYEGVNIVDLKRNMGKGAAMAAGVRATEADVIVFIDADLSGLHAYHVDNIVRPVLNGSDMCIGVFRRGKFWTDAAQVIAPYISGQRAMRRELIEQISWLEECRMGAEATINTVARKKKMRIRRVVLDGVTHACKERKFGFAKGTAQRAKMYAEIGKAVVRTRRRLSR